MLAEISPVYAPFSSKYTFSAPTEMRRSLNAFTATEMLQAGTQIRVSHHLARGMIFFSSSANFLVSVAVMFIFQLPAITVLRYLRFILSIISLLCLMKNGDGRCYGRGIHVREKSNML